MVLLALAYFAMKPLVAFVVLWIPVESLPHLDDGSSKSAQTCQAMQGLTDDAAHAADGTIMMQGISLPRRLTEVQWRATDGADLVEMLREAVRLTGFKQSAGASGRATHKQQKKQTEQTTMRVAYLLTGDAFRSSRRQLESSSCGQGSEEPQLRACKSQLSNIIKPLEQAGYDVSLYGVTYPCSGGQQLVEGLPGMFDGYMKGFSVATRSNATYGGQVTGWRASVSQVMKDVSNHSDWFDYYIITRWDLLAENVTTPEFWRCVLDGQRVARHLGNLMAFTTDDAWGLVNMDFMMVVPGSLMENLYGMLLTNPERCCSTSYKGTACVLCADNLNSDAGTTDAAPINCPGLERSLQLGKNAPLMPP